MNKLGSIMIAAAVTVFAFAGSAQAATLDIVLGSASNSIANFSFGGGPAPDINLSTPAPATLTLLNDAHLETATDPGEYVEPSGPLFGGNFLAVIASPAIAGTATFTLASNEDHFGFTWGTIDSYNTLLITDSRGKTYSISGATILSELTTLGSSPVAGSTQSNVLFSDPFGTIVSAQLTSSTNSFEAANFSEYDSAATPLPAALPLFGMALLGLGVFAYRRRSAVKL